MYVLFGLAIFFRRAIDFINLLFCCFYSPMLCIYPTYIFSLPYFHFAFLSYCWYTNTIYDCMFCWDRWWVFVKIFTLMSYSFVVFTHPCRIFSHIYFFLYHIFTLLFFPIVGISIPFVNVCFVWAGDVLSQSYWLYCCIILLFLLTHAVYLSHIYFFLYHISTLLFFPIVGISIPFVNVCFVWTGDESSWRYSQ